MHNLKMSKRKRDTTKNSAQIDEVAKQAVTKWIPLGMERTLVGLELAHEGIASTLALQYLNQHKCGGKNLPPFVPSLFRGLDCGGLIAIRQMIPRLIPRRDDLNSRVGVILAVTALAQLDLDLWIQIFETTQVQSTLGKDTPATQCASLIKAIRETVLTVSPSNKRCTKGHRYQCNPIEPKQEDGYGLLTMLKDIMGIIITQPTILDGRVDKCGKLIQTVRGVGPLVALDITRSLQLLGYLNLIDALPTKLGSSLGPFKNITSIFKRVFGRKPSVSDAEEVIRSMQRQGKEVALKSWEMQFSTKYHRWENAINILYNRTPSILDMEMLCCEVSKIESGLAVQAGLAKKPRKNYFNVENEWSLEWLASFRGKYGKGMLENVALSVVKENGTDGLELLNVNLLPSMGCKTSTSSSSSLMSSVLGTVKTEDELYRSEKE